VIRTRKSNILARSLSCLCSNGTGFFPPYQTTSGPMGPLRIDLIAEQIHPPDTEKVCGAPGGLRTGIGSCRQGPFFWPPPVRQPSRVMRILRILRVQFEKLPCKTNALYPQNPLRVGVTAPAGSIVAYQARPTMFFHFKTQRYSEATRDVIVARGGHLQAAAGKNAGEFTQYASARNICNHSFQKRGSRRVNSRNAVRETGAAIAQCWGSFYESYESNRF
jgi:hypothetical protein